MMSRSLVPAFPCVAVPEVLVQPERQMAAIASREKSTKNIVAYSAFGNFYLKRFYFNPVDQFSMRREIV